MTGAAPSVWEDATLAAALFAVDPAGLAGVAVRGGPGVARDLWLAKARALLPPGAPFRRAPLHIEDDRLLGGLDLAASLAAGRPVAQRGVLAECDGGVVVLPMAERIEAGVAARLATVLDRGEVALERDGLTLRLPARIGVIALDEGLEPDERPPEALIERLAFRLDLTGLGGREAPGEDGPNADTVAAARARLDGVGPVDDSIIEGLCAAAIMLDVASARGPILALRAARAHAALSGRSEVQAEDAAVAARLVLGARARRVPAEAEPEPAEDDRRSTPENAADPPPSAEPPPETDTPSQTDMVIEAIQAALPDDLLERVRLEGAPRSRNSGTRGAGADTKSARRGRPVGSRQGAFRSGDRLNLVETLRAATPWQKLRGGGGDAPTGGRIQVRREDFRIRRFVQRAESTTIFVVDASGSAAFQRLAEAKGAVELLLAKAYVSRTRVALIAFRGAEADILLPPTRSLTRAKRRLADLPGGGGTPLASGMDAALALALAERGMDRTPTLVFLTDGRANIGRDGAPGRRAAEDDAMAAAGRVRNAGVAAVYLDTSARPRLDGDRFARAMDAVYAPLPYANAGAMFDIVDDLRGGRR